MFPISIMRYKQIKANTLYMLFDIRVMELPNLIPIYALKIRKTSSAP